jgi:hypothetical protein
MLRVTSVLLLPLILTANIAQAAVGAEAAASSKIALDSQASAGPSSLPTINGWKLAGGPDEANSSARYRTLQPAETPTEKAESPKNKRQGLFLIFGGSLLLGLAAVLIAGSSSSRSGSGCPGGADLCTQ